MGGFSLFNWLILLVPAAVAWIGYFWKRAEFAGGVAGLIVAAAVGALLGWYLAINVATPRSIANLHAIGILGMLIGSTITVFISHKIFAARHKAS